MSILNSVQGMSPILCSDIAERLEMSGNTRDGKALFKELSNMQNRLMANDIVPSVYFNEKGVPVEFHVLRLASIEGSCHLEEFRTPSLAIEHFFKNKESSNRLKQKSNDLERAIKTGLEKLYLKKQRLSEDLLKAENSDDMRLYGELITANLHLIQPGSDKVTLKNYYNDTDVTIPIDKRFNAVKNAQIYFKKYGKSKVSIKEKTAQLQETDRDIEYLESVMSFIEAAESPEVLDEIKSELVANGYLRKRKNAFESKKKKLALLEYRTREGSRVVAGRNNTENDHLTFRMAGPKDYWFHTKDIPGSHVILFTEGRPLTEEVIFETASIAAFHSKARYSQNVPVDYVQVRYVKKPNGAKPGMVIFTNNRTVYVEPKLPGAEAAE